VVRLDPARLQEHASEEPGITAFGEREAHELALIGRQPVLIEERAMQSALPAGFLGLFNFFLPQRVEIESKMPAWVFCLRVL